MSYLFSFSTTLPLFDLIGLSLPGLKLWFIALWAAWFTIVAVGNFFDLLKSAGVLPVRWQFASGNYSLIAQAVAIYPHPPRWLSWFLYAGVIGWQALITALLWTAVLLFRADPASLTVTNAAFALSLTHWLAFMVADEIWRQWELQRAHMLAFLCQLGTLLTIHFL